MAQEVLEPPPPAGGAPGEGPRARLPSYAGPYLPRSRQEAWYLYEQGSKSVLGALALELVLPSAGLFYVGRYGEAGMYWALILTGAVLLVSDLPPGPGDNLAEGPGARFWGGLALIGFVRLGAIVYAPYLADLHNQYLAWRLGLRRHYGAAGPPGTGPSLLAGRGRGWGVVLPVLSLSF